MLHQQPPTSPPADIEVDKAYGIEYNEKAAMDGPVDLPCNADEKTGHVQMKSELDSFSFGNAFTTFKRSALICGLAGFSAATDGYQSQLTSSLVANKGFILQFGFPNTAKSGAPIELVPSHVSTFGGLFSAGMVVGQFSIQWMHNWLGRKGAMWTFMAVITLAAIIECVSTVWWHFAIAKLVAGAGIGSVQATLPVYINEHAPVSARGFFIVAYGLWYTLGGLMCSVGLTTFNSNPDTAYNWRLPVYTQFAMIGLALIIYWFIPESPWWLVSKGKVDKAKKIMQWKNANIPGYDVDTEVEIIAATIEAQNQWDKAAEAEGPFAIFKGLNAKRFIIGCWPKVLQQFVGLGVFSSYSAYFFQLAGNKNPLNVTVILGSVSLLATILDGLLVDRIGRRRMTLIGFGGACFGVSLMAIVGCFDYASNAQLGAVLVFAGAAANFFNTFQSTTSYAYLTEMPEQRFRARACGWGLAFCNLWAVLFNFTIPLMIANWVVKTAFLFMGLGIPGTILAYFIMPESMKRSPAEIHEMFVEGVPLRKWRGHKTQVERDLELITGRPAVA